MANQYNAQSTLPTQRSYVVGEYIDNASGETFVTRHPGNDRVICEVENSGSVWINDYNITPPEVPFGGYKQSGLDRENGLQAIEHYTQVKTVYANLGDVPQTY